MLKTIKKEIRILGIDDAPFDKFRDKKVLVVATVFRGGNYLDGLLSCHVDVDGNDATKKLVDIVKKTRHFEQLRCIMLDGIALGGFNVIDINGLAKATKLPVIVIIKKFPDLKKIENALKKINQEKKITLLKKAGKIYPCNKIYFQCAGISKESARKIIKLTATHSLIPEPLRIAHIIASGIALGESHGHA